MTTERITTTNDRAQLPVTLEEAKAHLCVTEDFQDELLRSYLEAAVDWARETTRRAIAKRDYLITRDRFPFQVWELPLGKIQSITSVKYIDLNGALLTWTGSPLPYEIDLATEHNPRLRPKENDSWPSTGNFLSAAQVRVTAGWDQDDIPFTVRSAILLKLAELNEARAPGDPEGEAQAAAAASLLSNWTLPIWR